MFKDILQKEQKYILALVIVTLILGARFLYERANPLALAGRPARVVAIPSTGKDINSPVSFLFGRAPYFILCDRAARTYKAVPNKFMDSQHAAGLSAGKMLAGKKIDAVCANNIGFEPMRVFHSKKIEVYTGIHGTVWQTLESFPDSLTKITEQNVPAHFGITGSKTPIACSSFDVQANLPDIVQGKFYMCYDCGYRISEAKLTNGVIPAKCPACGMAMHEVITVAEPLKSGLIKPKVRVF